MRPKLIEEFVSSPREAHATGYGIGLGYALNTDDRLVRLGLLALLFLGDTGVDTDARPGKELNAERQYSLVGFLAGVFLAGAANRVSNRSGD